MLKHPIKKLSELIEKFSRTETGFRLLQKYPKTFQFISKRSSLKKFQGLPLTVLVLTIIANLLLIANLTAEIINSKEAVAIDNFVAERLFKIRSEKTATVFYYISQTCSVSWLLIISCFVAAYFLLKRRFHFVVGLIISLSGSGATVYLGKVFFKINRPMKYAYYIEDNFSFPSGHATTAVAFYGLLFYFFGRGYTRFNKWTMIIVIASLFFVLIGFSRLYLGVHYLSDVVIGYLLGLLWLLLSISIIEWQEHKGKKL